MSVKQFKFSVENTRTRESTAFIGQGETIAEALKDGMKCVEATFRPKSDGQNRGQIGLAVHLANGSIVNRPLREFESDLAFGASKVEAPAIEDLD